MWMLSILALQSESTFRKLLSDIPHDGAAIFVYLLLVGCVVLIWRAGRKKA